MTHKKHPQTKLFEELDEQLYATMVREKTRQKILMWLEVKARKARRDEPPCEVTVCVGGDSPPPHLGGKAMMK